MSAAFEMRSRASGKSSLRRWSLTGIGELSVVIGEVLTTSPVNKGKDAWLQRTVESSGRSLGQVRDKLFELAGVQRHHLVLDVNAGTGLLTWEAVRKAPEGGVWALTSDQQAGEALRQQAERLSELERPFILIGSLDELEYLMTLRGDEEMRFDRVLARNLFTQNASVVTEMGQLIREWLGENGRFCLAQTIPQHGQRLYQLVDWSQMPEAIYPKSTSC